MALETITGIHRENRFITMALIATVLACMGMELLSPTPVGATDYSIRRLPTLPDGSVTQAYSINNSGWVVGITGNGISFRPFLFNGTGTLDLSTVPRDISWPTGFEPVSATSINNNGWVAGWGANSDGIRNSFLYDGTRIYGLDPPGSGYGSMAYGINDLGQVTGSANTYVYLYNRSDGMMFPQYDIGNGAKSTIRGIGYAININGQITGGANDGYGFLLDTKSGTRTNFFSLNGSEGRAINDPGSVTGYYQPGSQSPIAFLHNSDGVENLLPGVPNTLYQPRIAYGINNNGQIVGEAWTLSQDMKPFLYENGTTKLIWPSSGDGYDSWSGLLPQDINDKGQIAGYGSLGAFIMTPIDGAPVPIPGTLVLFGSGLLGLVGIGRKRRKKKRRYFRRGIAPGGSPRRSEW